MKLKVKLLMAGVLFFSLPAMAAEAESYFILEGDFENYSTMDGLDLGTHQVANLGFGTVIPRGNVNPSSPNPNEKSFEYEIGIKTGETAGGAVIGGYFLRVKLYF